MKKTVLKLAVVAIAVPVLLGGLALPATAAVVPAPGIAAQPAPEATMGLPKDAVSKLPDVFSLSKAPAATLPVKSPAVSGPAATKAAAVAGPSAGPTKAIKTKTANEFSAVRKANPWLGKATGFIQYNPGSGTATKKYKGGTIVGVPGGRAHALKPAIRDAYFAYGTPTSQYLGYPLGAEEKLKNGATVQRFLSGDIHWTAKGGAHHVVPWGTWDQHGGINGRLGYPTSDWITDGTKGFHQDFKGGTITATPTKVPGHMNMKVTFKKK